MASRCTMLPRTSTRYRFFGRRIDYAKRRWGCTLFYVDSTATAYTWINPDVFKAVADAYPDVLLIPENESMRYFAYSAPLNSYVHHKITSTPVGARMVYPKSFSVLMTSDGDRPEDHAALVDAVRHDDILLFNGRYNDAGAEKIKKIYEEAAQGIGDQRSVIGRSEVGDQRSIVGDEIMQIESAKDLDVYKLASEFAMEIFEITKRFPSEEKYALTSQIRRSSRSVCLNLREAWAKRRYTAHFVSKLTDCDGENSETDSFPARRRKPRTRAPQAEVAKVMQSHAPAGMFCARYSPKVWTLPSSSDISRPNNTMP